MHEGEVRIGRKRLCERSNTSWGGCTRGFVRAYSFTNQILVSDQILVSGHCVYLSPHICTETTHSDDLFVYGFYAFINCIVLLTPQNFCYYILIFIYLL